LGYFAQNQAEYLDGEKTLLDTMIDAATDANRSKVRDILGSFLFRGDDVGKKGKSIVRRRAEPACFGYVAFKAHKRIING